MLFDPALVDAVAAQLTKKALAVVVALEPDGAAGTDRPAARRARIRNAAHDLLLSVARAATGDPTEATEVLQYGNSEKPRLSGEPPPFRFNISHSGDVWACAFSRTGEIGIDAESSPFRVLSDRHVGHFLDESEKKDMAEWISAADSIGVPAPVILWTLKEAALKWSGRTDGFLLSRMREVLIGAPRSAAATDVLYRSASGSNLKAPSAFATTAGFSAADGDKDLMERTTVIVTPSGSTVLSWCVSADPAPDGTTVFAAW